ncbi:hypothetical protein [Actinomadura terrae]|uniref:hypothetical protein n=1 Tax=Actinomadura terrae TaxID=604353 RepID=UPI001FA7531E|nr:hypothetical protein [Actinomadura terrae]
MHDITRNGIQGLAEPPARQLLGQPALTNGSAGLALALVVGVPIALYVVFILVIAWRAHRDPAGFDNNARLLELLLAGLPWRRNR